MKNRFIPGLRAAIQARQSITPEPKPTTTEELRDYFAGQALTGVISRGIHSDASTDEKRVNMRAATAWKYADAMLAARGK